MADIIKGMNIEKEYLKYKLQGEKVPYELVDEIKKSGFESLEDYFNNKREYLFNQLEFEIINTSSQDVEEAWCMLYEKINQKKTSAFLVDTTDTIVYINASKPFNEDYCIKNNLKMFKLPLGGGTIVSGKDDIAIVFVLPDNLQTDSSFILTGIKEILGKYEDNVAIVDNDVLINGNKVCGITFLRNNGMVVYLSHFSFSNNSELINLICHSDSKPVKPPSYITGLDKESLKMEVLKWLRYI